MNFSIIVPGDCNANCSFCFWEQEQQAPSYMSDLRQVLDTLSSLKDTYTCSLTGGEPTISPILHDILTALKERSNFSKIVLTTNAAGLEDKRYFPGDFAGVVSHVNISRHAVNDTPNEKVFGCSAVPTGAQLYEIIEGFNQKGIDVTINCVLCNQFSDRQRLLNFITAMRGLGASAVSFRKQHGNLDESEEEMWFKDYKVVSESSCPVCRAKQQLICGMPVYWKASTLEPSNDLGEVYELVFHPTGKLTADWAGNKQVKFANGKPYIDGTLHKVIKPSIEQRLDGIEKNIQALIKNFESSRRNQERSHGRASITRGCG